VNEMADGEQHEVFEYQHHDDRIVRVDDDELPVMLILSRGEPGQALAMSRRDAVDLAWSLLRVASPRGEA
jgi:hypothetical protein